MTGRGKEESLIPCQSAQSKWWKICPLMSYIPSALWNNYKRRENLLTPSLDYYMRFLMEYMCMDFFKGNGPVCSKQPSSQIVMPCLVALSLNSPVPPATDANPSPILPLYTCASLQDLGHMAQLISVLLTAVLTTVSLVRGFRAQIFGDVSPCVFGSCVWYPYSLLPDLLDIHC